MAKRQEDNKGGALQRMAPQPQRGNTLLGFIIGVVVGLAAALAVAVYVTKVPVPFLSKGQSRTPDQDAAEAKKNKDWDPNAPLYGKQATKAAPSASGAITAAPAAAASAVVPAVAPGKQPATPAVAAISRPVAVAAADPLGDLAKAKMGAAAEPFTYFVQVGAFRTAEDAEAQRAKLALAGVEAKVSEREQSGRTVFRVRVGPFEHKDEGEKAKERLEASGLETALIRVAR